VDGVACPEGVLVNYPPGVLGESGVKLDHDQVCPSLAEVSLSCRDLLRGEASISSSASECRVALDVSDPARRSWSTLVEEAQDEFAPFLGEKCIDQRAGVQVRAQNRSSLM
jgi:hypothetical protein